MHKIEKISEELQKAREYESHALSGETMAPKQAFHVCAPVGWINDPNGFSAYQGEYHLFYQYHPYSIAWGPMHWGHVKTKDFMSWEQLPVAIAPDSTYDSYGCFSGSAIEWEGKHILIYTGVAETEGADGTRSIRQMQCIAVGDGLNYEKILENPVIAADTLPEGSSLEDFRDPKAWQDGAYVYLVAGSRAKDGSGQIPVYRTKNLKEWEFLNIVASSENQLGKMWECPDFFELSEKQVLLISPQEVSAKGLEFHNGNATAAIIGHYDKHTHKFVKEKMQAVDYGLDFYAPQTMETQDGRRIMIAWMESWDNQLFPPQFGWNGMMSVPRELFLEKGRLCQLPVKEIKNYYTNSIRYENIEIQGKQRLEGITGRYNDLSVEICRGDYSEMTINLACNEEYTTSLIYNKKKNLLILDRAHSGISKDVICTRQIEVADNEGAIKLRVIMDRYSIEVFINEGEQAASMLIFTPIEADGIEFVIEGQATATIERHEICATQQ